MTTVARKVAAVPERSASETWSVMTEILSKSGTSGRAELDSVAGIAATLVSDECFRDSPGIVSGSGPQVRMYCVYGEDSVSGDGVKEDALAFEAAAGEWSMSLPCNEEDLDWVSKELEKKSTRITARDLAKDVETKSARAASAGAVEIDVEAFLKL